MEFMGLLVPVLSGSTEIKGKLESVFGQPVDNISKCVSQFMDGIKNGPGLVEN